MRTPVLDMLRVEDEPEIRDSPVLPESLGDDVAIPFDHRVQFYEHDEFLYRVVREFFSAGQRAGEPLVVIATDLHRRQLRAELGAGGFDVDRLQRSGQLTLLDAEKALAGFMVDGTPDRELFLAQIGDAVAKARSASRNGHVRAFGEMVDLLWQEGNPRAMLRLEELWNELGQDGTISLLCAYFISTFDSPARVEDFQQICAHHAHVIPSEGHSMAGDQSTRLDEVRRLQQRARALEGEIEHRKRLEQALRGALAERKRAEEALRESQQELLDFFENAVEGFHWVGPGGVILAANRAELELLGYSKNEYIGRNVTEFHVDQDVIADILARLGRNETLRGTEARLRCKDGSIKHVLIHSNVFFRNGEFIHTRCFTRDITDRKRLEDELRRQNEDLSRTVRFSEMFVGILGHDLRNPLSAIATAASLLGRRADSDKVAKPATRILNSAARMGRMIDQLLDFTRIRLGKGIPLQQRQTDLGEVCRLAIDELESTGETRKIQLKPSGDPIGFWDADRLLQLASNLLGNALAHGAGSDPIAIRVDGTDGGCVVLEIQNAGVVPAEVMPVLFEPFRSGANEKQARSGGLGLGLFISQQIAISHAGTIDVTSSESEGTRLRVRLPRTPPRSEPAFVSAGDTPQ
jgi:PAS domain S-box-containing protein